MAWKPVLPDSWCGSLSREAATTFFKPGKYSDGLVYIVKAVAFRIAEDKGVKLNGIPEQVHHPAEDQSVPIWVSSAGHDRVARLLFRESAPIPR